MKTYKGYLKNGVVVFDEPPPLGEGTEVTVQVSEEEAPPDETIAERMGHLLGMIDDLPEDMAERHDHYLYGTD
jgi:hypothetical protein